MEGDQKKKAQEAEKAQAKVLFVSCESGRVSSD
jgi:hypothetical protein